MKEKKIREKLKEKLKKDLLRFESTLEDFPFMCCTDVSGDLGRKYRFLMARGYYTGEKDSGFFRSAFEDGQELSREIRGIVHDFNYDPQTGLYIDLSARQFNKRLPKILILDQNDPRLAHTKKEVNKKTLLQVESYSKVPKLSKNTLLLESLHKVFSIRI